MSIFKDGSMPRETRARLREIVAENKLDEMYAEGPAVNGLLRAVGLYDDKQPRFHMLRIRIPGGWLTAEQTRAIGQLTDELCERPDGYEDPEFPDRILELSTRQNIQVHWVRLERMPEIWDRLSAVGLNSLQACGDATRNITGDSIDGIDPDAFFDVKQMVFDLNKWLLDHPEESATLPRKFKIALTGSALDGIASGVNDMAFMPAKKDGEFGFHLRVGGGLSDYPRVASELDAFIRFDQVLEVTRAVLKVYKAFGEFENKAVNRFRRVVSELGMERTQKEIQDRLDFTLEPRGESLVSGVRQDYIGIHKQRQDGLYYAGLAVPVGRMHGAELTAIADLAEQYGDGGVVVTLRQNLIVTGIPEAKLEAFKAEPLVQQFSPDMPTFNRFIVACTASPFCKFGILNTKITSKNMADELDEFFKDKDIGPIRIHMTGCKASCAQPQIADIGLRSSIAKDEEDLYPAFDVCIGGNQTFGQLARWVKGDVPVPNAVKGIKSLVGDYLDQRSEGQTFGEYVRGKEPEDLGRHFEEISL